MKYLFDGVSVFRWSITVFFNVSKVKWFESLLSIYNKNTRSAHIWMIVSCVRRVYNDTIKPLSWPLQEVTYHFIKSQRYSNYKVWKFLISFFFIEIYQNNYVAVLVQNIKTNSQNLLQSTLYWWNLYSTDGTYVYETQTSPKIFWNFSYIDTK